MNKQIRFIFNPSELGAGTRGSSLGPNAILAAARSKKSTLFENREIRIIPDHNYLLNKPVETSFAKNIDGIVNIFSSVYQEINKTLSSSEFPLIIAGDHSSAGATISSISSFYPNKKIGVLWIDAHADLHTPYTTPSGNVHGMPLAIALGTDNIKCKKNNLDEWTIEKWNTLKSSSLKSDNLIYIAVRDTEKEEDFVIDLLNIKNYKVEEVRELGIKNLIHKLKEKFVDIDYLYVSFDVDSMDPELTSHGTGTPVPNGLSPEEAKEILVELCKFDNLVAIEIVEVNPCLDEKKNKMAETAFDILESIVETLEN
ncbi:MAG: arginase [Bacteroidetes bacterium]|nr:arginase [Bacteroidota bacterium]